MTIDAPLGSRGEHAPAARPQPVAIAGFGLVGEALAVRLLRAGHCVRASDPDPGRRARMAQVGVRAVSLTELASGADCVVIAVYDAREVADVLGALGPSSTPVLCTTTLAVEEAVRLSRKAGLAGLQFIEMPISGSSREIEDGSALALLGDAVAAAPAAAALRAMCPRVLHVRGVGAPAAVKLAINLVLELNRAALAEGLLFAQMAGVDLALAERAFAESAAASRVIARKAPKMRLGRFEPEGRLEQSLKDLRILLATARQPAALPLTQALAGLLEQAVREGEGAFDSAALIRSLRRRTTLMEIPPC